MVHLNRATSPGTPLQARRERNSNDPFQLPKSQAIRIAECELTLGRRVRLSPSKNCTGEIVTGPHDYDGTRGIIVRILDSGFPVFVPIKPPSKAVGSGASDAEKEARKHEVAVEQLSRAIIMMENSLDTKETAIAEANHALAAFEVLGPNCEITRKLVGRYEKTLGKAEDVLQGHLEKIDSRKKEYRTLSGRSWGSQPQKLPEPVPASSGKEPHDIIMPHAEQGNTNGHRKTPPEGVKLGNGFSIDAQSTIEVGCGHCDKGGMTFRYSTMRRCCVLCGRSSGRESVASAFLVLAVGFVAFTGHLFGNIVHVLA